MFFNSYTIVFYRILSLKHLWSIFASRSIVQRRAIQCLSIIREQLTHAIQNELKTALVDREHPKRAVE